MQILSSHSVHKVVFQKQAPLLQVLLLNQHPHLGEGTGGLSALTRFHCM